MNIHEQMRLVLVIDIILIIGRWSWLSFINMADSGFLKDLPFESECISNDEEKIEIRAKLMGAEEANEWLRSYEELSATHWIVRNTYPHLQRLEYRKDYVCHHAAFNKETPSEGCNRRGKSKNCQCPAKLSITIRSWTSRDTHSKRGLLGKILVTGRHNHSRSNAEALSLLPASHSLRSVFEGYFGDGQGISEATRFHVEKMELSGCTEADLADSTKNPKYRTVQHWFTEWRLKHQGPRTGDGVIDTLDSKLEGYTSMGCKVLTRKDPLVVVIVTPIMQRAQELSDAGNVCFVDSTASCDASNHSITFMLTPCAAGAVPLAVIITSGQSQADYEGGFMLLKGSCGNFFGGSSHPAAFMTDDSDAERNALAATWPESKLRLCLFHVQQANWRWLWDSKNSIMKEDRPLLMNEFRQIMMATSKEGAMETFNSALTSRLSVKYPHWQKRIQKYFERCDEWCIAWRSAVHRGHHTNNYSEVTVRLFKDIVLSRLKAYNVVSLVDFVSSAMEEYYSHRLLQFAHSRVALPHIWLRKQILKAAYVNAEAIRQTSDSIYNVPSEHDASVFYSVDVDVGICSCQDGMCGRFCKHQAAILKHVPDVMLPNAPPVDTAARHRMAVVALGDKAQEASFYEPFTADDQPSHSTQTSPPKSTESVLQIDEPMDQQQSNESTSAAASHAVVDDGSNLACSMFDAMKHLHDQFGTSTASVTRVLTRLGKIHTGNQWESFMHSCGSAVPLRLHHRAAIRVQPTSLARRRPGITRGSKRLPGGRPPSSDPLRRKTKRPRNLNYNVLRNQPNAKSHGDGH